VADLAALNALLNRAPDGPLAVPGALAVGRPLVGDDAQILAMAAESNPELKAESREIAGRHVAIERAKQEYLPDVGINVTTDLAGVAQTVLGSVSAPVLRYQAIDAELNQAKANLRAADAKRRQAVHDLASEVSADLAAVRDAERQADLYEKTVLPRAREAVNAVQNAYGNGHATLLELLDAQRSLIALRQMIAELRTEREKRVANLEAAAGQVLTGR
jgi:cobalt-zinc-cadmium efflux system outer membrane protein